MNEVLFKLPDGFAAWCHICAEPPFNKTTDVRVRGENLSLEDTNLQPDRIIKVPGCGFRSLQESMDHKKVIHQEYKG